MSSLQFNKCQEYTFVLTSPPLTPLQTPNLHTLFCFGCTYIFSHSTFCRISYFFHRHPIDHFPRYIQHTNLSNVLTLTFHPSPYKWATQTSCQSTGTLSSFMQALATLSSTQPPFFLPYLHSPLMAFIPSHDPAFFPIHYSLLFLFDSFSFILLWAAILFLGSQALIQTFTSLLPAHITTPNISALSNIPDLYFFLSSFNFNTLHQCLNFTSYSFPNSLILMTHLSSTLFDSPSTTYAHLHIHKIVIKPLITCHYS